MFSIICKIGPLDITTYAVIVSVIAAVSIVVLIVMACSGGITQGRLAAVLFWTLVLAVLAMIPLLTTVTIYSYGLMMAVAVIVSTLLLIRDARRKNLHADVIFDLVFWVVVVGVAGARLFYVFLNYPFFVANPNEIIMIQNGGLAWQGGLVAGAAACIFFVRSRKLFLPEVLDLLAPYLALGQSIGRIGCFLNGCCFGKELAGGIYFPVHGAELHPTQLYLSGGLFIVFLILRQYQKFSQIPGLVFALYLILASILRFGVEFFRADHEMIVFGLSVYQFVCFAIFVFALFFAFSMLIKHSNPDDSF